MPRGNSAGTPSAASLIPIALIAAAILVLSLVVSAPKGSGTIVVQKLSERFGGTTGGGGAHPSMSITFVAETTAAGHMRRLFTTTSVNHGLEGLVDGPLREVYLSRNNTVYVMTQESLMRAEDRLLHRPVNGRERTYSFSYDGTWMAPGRTSFFAVQLRRHNYRIAGRTTIAGRPALKLVPVHSANVFAVDSPARMLLEPAYVSPGSYDPIAGSPLGPGTDVFWTEYRVLPDTAANRRLLSLTARHPRAHVSFSVDAYLRAVRLQLARR
jgi:hypothetical protein